MLPRPTSPTTVSLPLTAGKVVGSMDPTLAMLNNLGRLLLRYFAQYIHYASESFSGVSTVFEWSTQETKEEPQMNNYL